jgi:hypothetical protein
VLERPLRILATVLSLLVAAGFALFAIDDFARASNASRDRIAGNARPDPTPRAEREREARNSEGRELVDDANDVLLRPFAGLVADTHSRWVQRGVPALLGLLLYGFVLGYLARYARGSGRRRTPPRDRRRRASRA